MGLSFLYLLYEAAREHEWMCKNNVMELSCVSDIFPIWKGEIVECEAGAEPYSMGWTTWLQIYFSHKVGLLWDLYLLQNSSLVVVDLGLTTPLTSQFISVAFYTEREKSDKFCSEALISAWGSFTCRKSTTRDTSFPKEVILRIFYALKKFTDSGRVWTRESRI